MLASWTSCEPADGPEQAPRAHRSPICELTLIRASNAGHEPVELIADYALVQRESTAGRAVPG